MTLCITINIHLIKNINENDIMTCYNKHYDIRHVLHVCFFFLLASLLVHENIETEILPNIKNMISLIIAY